MLTLQERVQFLRGSARAVPLSFCHQLACPEISCLAETGTAELCPNVLAICALGLVNPSYMLRCKL